MTLYRDLPGMLERGEITAHDMEEAERFASFLAAVGVTRTRVESARLRAAYREHYPDDYARDVGRDIKAAFDRHPQVVGW